jgi:hypothetical protein
MLPDRGVDNAVPFKMHTPHRSEFFSLAKSSGQAEHWQSPTQSRAELQR